MTGATSEMDWRMEAESHSVTIPVATSPLLAQEISPPQAHGKPHVHDPSNLSHILETRRRLVGRALLVATCVSLAILLWTCIHGDSVAESSGDASSAGTSGATGGSSFSSSAAARFLVLGDWGRDGEYNQSLVATQMARVAADMAPQFVISTGDNFYDSGIADVAAQQFTTSFMNVYSQASLQVPWYSVLGNHDYYGNALAQLHPHLSARDPRWVCRRSMVLSLPLCSNAQGVSCTDLLDIFLYDTTPLVREYRSEPHRSLDWRGLNANNWTKQERAQLKELEGWLRNSQATWKVVIGHHPVYSFGDHGNQQELVEAVKPLLERHNVQLYMNGHDHNLQHIRRDDSPVNYVTSGGGSKAWREAPPAADAAPGLQYFWPGQGFVAVEVDAGEVRLSFVGVDGSVMYETRLSKEGR
ncbi:unnamed protein product [Closterium sp. NIES-64]|nr:unnamed protein product [Closterium sp. NIES-64]